MGTYLRSADLAVMRLLLALTPELLGIEAQELTLEVDTDDGYVLKSDRGWRALFGHYTPTVQPPDIIPAQVQCLQWLLASQERKLEQVFGWRSRTRPVAPGPRSNEPVGRGSRKAMRNRAASPTM